MPRSLAGSQFDEFIATLPTFQGIVERLVWRRHFGKLAVGNVSFADLEWYVPIFNFRRDGRGCNGALLAQSLLDLAAVASPNQFPQIVQNLRQSYSATSALRSVTPYRTHN